MRLFLLACVFSFSLATGCASAAPARAGQGETLSVMAGRESREFILYTPERATGPVPVVLVFHGGGGGAEWMARKSQTLTRTLTEAGYAVAYMNGSSRRGGDKLRTWNAAHCCAYAQRRNIDETAYADAAIEALDARLRIDRARIFLTGHSNGAMLSYRLAGAIKVTPRAIAPISGAIFADQPDMPARTSIFMYHAQDDEVLSYSGSPDDKAERWRTQPHLGFVTAEAKLAEMKACGAATGVSSVPGITATTRSCAGGSVLVATTTSAGGHEWLTRPQADYRIEDALLLFFNSQK